MYQGTWYEYKHTKPETEMTKIFKKGKSEKQKYGSTWVISGGTWNKHDSKPKNNREKHGVQDYHIWEVREVNRWGA